MTSTFDTMNTLSVIASIFTAAIIGIGINILTSRHRRQQFIRNISILCGITIFALLYYFLATAFPAWDFKYAYALAIGLGAGFGGMSGDYFYKKSRSNKTVHRTIHSAALSGESKFD